MWMLPEETKEVWFSRRVKVSNTFVIRKELRLIQCSAHEQEKQYECAYCKNRFKNKNEAERHQNSLHLRRHSWSCASLSGNYEAVFHVSTTRADSDTCGFCGEDFIRTGISSPSQSNTPVPIPSEKDWEIRIMHLQEMHKFGECNHAKKFFRADHFRQHLKHSHAGTSGKWTNMLENACMKEEPLPEPINGSGSRVGMISEEEELRWRTQVTKLRSWIFWVGTIRVWSQALQATHLERSLRIGHKWHETTMMHETNMTAIHEIPGIGVTSVRVLYVIYFWFNLMKRTVVAHFTALMPISCEGAEKACSRVATVDRHWNPYQSLSCTGTVPHRSRLFSYGSTLEWIPSVAC